MSRSGDDKTVSRREFGVLASALGLGAWLGEPTRLCAAQSAPASSGADGTRSRKRVLRLVHMTDMHIQPERRAGEGTAACLRHIQSLKDVPQLIITGGDTIMDSFDCGQARTQTQWGLWKSVMKDNCSLRVESCIGNHDVWGWNRKKSGCTGQEALYGKKWVCEVFGRDKPYRSFDLAGWHFIMLDSVFPHNDGYLGKLDDEQFAWLESDLKALDAKTPVALVSHIPILSAAPMIRAKMNAAGDVRSLSNSEVHADGRKLIGLFTRHRNVKTCLSGHIHEVDRIDFQGVTYLCNGAVSGNWWKGRHYDCDEGYALVDLFDDGTLECAYVPFGWKADPA